MCLDQRPLMGTFSKQPKCPEVEFMKEIKNVVAHSKQEINHSNQRLF